MERRNCYLIKIQIQGEDERRDKNKERIISRGPSPDAKIILPLFYADSKDTTEIIHHHTLKQWKIAIN